MEIDPVASAGASPPILYVDEGGGVGPLFASVPELVEYLEWPEQFDGEPALAYDCRGRRLTLAVEAERGPVVVSISSDADPAALEALLQPLVRARPMRFGLLDADVELDTLLRAVWPHMRWGSGPYPTG